MKYLCMVMVTAAAFLILSSESHAEEPKKRGPRIINLKMGDNELVFNHEKHQKMVKSACWECHDKKSGKIENWGEAIAHKLCIPCHDLNEKGPVKCKGCHKK
jgi:predicted CXXCH cytochrome family protein